MLRPLLPALAAAAALTALPAAAHAATGDPIYDVTMEADVHHTWSVDATSFAADTRLEGRIGQISLERGGNVVVDPAVSAEATMRSTGTYTQTGVTPPRSCSLDPEPRPDAVAIRESLLAPLDGSVRMDVRFAQQLTYVPAEGSGTCPESPFPGYLATEELGDGPLDAVVQMPKEVIGRGKTIELIEGPQAGRCPGSEWGGACELRWKATLTLTLVGHTGDLDPVPLVPSPTTPVTTPTVPAPTPTVPAPPVVPELEPVPLVPPAVSDPDLAPLVPASATASVARDGSSVAFRATCPGGCVGTATLRLAGRRAAPRAAGAAAGGIRLRVAVPAAARARTVRLAVPRRHRAALRRAGGGRLALRLAPADGGREVERTLRLRVAR